MMNFALAAMRDWIRKLPRESKIAVVQQHVFPEMDVQDLDALRQAIDTEIESRHRQHTSLISNIQENFK